VSLKGDPRTLKALGKALRNMPITVSAKIAARGAPAMTDLAQSAYDSGRTVYGSARPRGVDGDKLELVKSGASRNAMRFIATGRDMRTPHFPDHTRYLIGKYDVLPNGPLPAEWQAALRGVAVQVLDAEIHGAGGQT
jgi:hypothetical protein